MRIVLRWLSGFIIFFFGAIYITYPLFFNFGKLVTGYGDELLIAWIQNWVIHSVFSNIWGLFNTNTFYPFQGTLAYSDALITTSILAIPVKIFTSEPIAIFNFTMFSSLVLVPFSIFLLMNYLTKDYGASLVSGLLIQFSPVFLDKKIHVQIMSLEWIPMAVLFFIIFKAQKKMRYLCLSMFFFLCQIYNSFMPGYFLLFFYLIFLIYWYVKEKQSFKKLINKRVFGVTFITFLLILPVIIPYYQVSIKYHAYRDIRDAVHLALEPEDLLYANGYTRINGFLNSLPFNQHSQNNEFKPGYLGFILSILSLLALFYFFKNRKPDFIYNIFVISSLTGLILSLGPALHVFRKTVHIPFIVPLPYALFYYIFPGFQGFRNSSRFEMMFLIFMVLAVGIYLSKVLKSKLKKGFIYSILIVLIVAEFNYPMDFIKAPTLEETPKVYFWMKSIPDKSAGIIMPIFDWYMPGVGEEVIRDFYSTVNWRRLVNGASGYAPPEWGKLVAKLHEDFPKKSSIKLLENLGLSYIIVDKKLYDQQFLDGNQSVSGESVIKELNNNSSLIFIKKLENYYVFKLKR